MDLQKKKRGLRVKLLSLAQQKCHFLLLMKYRFCRKGEIFLAKSRRKKNALLGLLEQQRCQSILWPTELTMMMQIKRLRRKVRHET